MKTVKNIFVIFLSLLVMYVGGGISVIDYCLSGCQPLKMETCCCCKVKPVHGEEYAFTKEPCCQSAVYQIDLLKTSSTEGNVYFPLIVLPQEATVFRNNLIERAEVLLITYYPPPRPDTSRFYLHYFSTLLI